MPIKPNYERNAKDYIEISLKSKSKAQLVIEISRMNPVFYRNMFGDYPLEDFVDHVYAEASAEIVSVAKYETIHVNGPVQVKIIK